MRGLAQERQAAVVIVTHDDRIENIADRTLYLEDEVIKDERIVSP